MEKKESRLDYLYQCYRQGLPVTSDELEELHKEGYEVEFEKYEVRKPVKTPQKKKGTAKYNFSLKRDFTVMSDEELDRDEIDDIDVIESDEPYNETDEALIIDDDYKNDSETLIIHGFDRISKDDWCPESVIYHTKEFYAWIDSINKGFHYRIPYEPFNKYVQQANDWVSKGYNIIDYKGLDEEEFVVEEMERCSINSLYFSNKYGFLQEASEPSGRLKYIADDNYVHHQIMLYLFDSGYSVLLGKPRQIGATSVLGIAGIAKVITKLNLFLKFITQDKDTGLEIFRDKMMYPYSQLPDWMKTELVNDRENLFSINQSGKTKTKNKGKTGKRGMMSRIQIDAPTRTAINGGSPQIVFIDEVGSINILSEMSMEGRPTMFIKNRQTGLLEQRRQLWMWSTGTSEKGGASFEKEWSRIHTLWEQREPSVGIVPLFFDWHTRCDEKFYLEQKKYYYGGRAKQDNVDIETSKIQFHQHYPSTPADMFIPTGKTLVSRETIENNLSRIRDNMESSGVKMQYGYFEPLFDKSKPQGDNAPFPFKVIGANFIQTDAYDERVTTEILVPPDAKWVDRFYAGTDPITTDTGASRMATVIWDEQLHTIAAITDCKEANNPNFSFLQSMLLTIYYGTEKQAVPEVVERNISLAYRNMREVTGYIDSLLLNAQLEEYYQSGQPYDVGIDNHGKKTAWIIKKLGDIVEMFGTKMYHTVVFRQLSTFHCTITRSGNETWSSIDKRYYNDDVLFGLVYAYICARSIGRQPRNLDQMPERRVDVKYDIKLDKNYNLIRVPVTTMINGKQ